jgi:hypothetical protein
MTARQYATLLRQQGHSYASIHVMVSLVYGDVHLNTILNWLSEKRREAQRRYMREWMRKHRAAGKQPGKPVVDRNRFDIDGPFA